MSKTLILELSDEVYAIIQYHADIARTSPANLVAVLLEQQSRTVGILDKIKVSKKVTK